MPVRQLIFGDSSFKGAMADSGSNPGGQTPRLRWRVGGAMVWTLGLMSMVLSAGCGSSQGDRVREIVYWEKWTGFEGEAITSAVRRYNELELEKGLKDPEYIPIRVKLVTTSKIDQKLLVAVAGGTPPDVAGLYTFVLYNYADKGALMDLTPLAQRDGLSQADYLPVFWQQGWHRGKLWSLPSTPASSGLHWNKRLFREAGLDPDTAPVTLEELDAFARRLTLWELKTADGRISRVRGWLSDLPAHENRELLQVGFLPSEPGWWSWSWGHYFGAKMWDGDKKITLNTPEMIRAFDWVRRYSENIGVEEIRRLRSSFGSFSSPQNPFMAGQVAMVIQGVWMNNFIERYAPGMVWGAAPFPATGEHPEMHGACSLESDLLVIPRDSKHPEEAWAFMKWMNSREGMELLCLGQQKFTPLAQNSEDFWRTHPHPHIKMFRDLALLPGGIQVPKLGIWNEMRREVTHALEVVTNLNGTSAEILTQTEARLQRSLDRDIERLERRGMER